MVETKVVTLKNGRTRRLRSELERRQIVEETLKPGASVALIARVHDVNANQLFRWKRQYEQGRLDIKTATTPLPVKNLLNPPPARKFLPKSAARPARSGREVYITGIHVPMLADNI